MRDRTRGLVRPAIEGLAIGAIASVLPLELLIPATSIAIAVALSMWNRAGTHGPRAFRGIAMAAVLLAAHLAPCKADDRLARRTVELSAASFSLGELADLPTRQIVARFPSDLTENERRPILTFPATRMDFRTFQETVEEQTSLRLHRSYCGSGASVLWGSGLMYLVFENRQAAR